jgi:hypothetical protein
MYPLVKSRSEVGKFTTKLVEKTGEITSRAQKKKHLSPSTRRRNAQRMVQWKAKREAVGDNKTCISNAS